VAERCAKFDTEEKASPMCNDATKKMKDKKVAINDFIVNVDVFVAVLCVL